MFHTNKMGSIIRSTGTVFYSFSYLNSRQALNGLKYMYSVIPVIVDSLPGNTKNRESTRSWTARVRLFHPWAEVGLVTHMTHSCDMYHTDLRDIPRMKHDRDMHSESRETSPAPTMGTSSRTGTHNAAHQVPRGTHSNDKRTPTVLETTKVCGAISSSYLAARGLCMSRVGVGSVKSEQWGVGVAGEKNTACSHEEGRGGGSGNKHPGGAPDLGGGLLTGGWGSL